MEQLSFAACNYLLILFIQMVMNHSCMFWDFNIRYISPCVITYNNVLEVKIVRSCTCSDWSAKGITTRVSPDGTYICTTTHLTSFAVLVGLTTPDNVSTILSTFIILYTFLLSLSTYK